MSTEEEQRHAQEEAEEARRHAQVEAEEARKDSLEAERHAQKQADEARREEAETLRHKQEAESESRERAEETKKHEQEAGLKLLCGSELVLTGTHRSTKRDVIFVEILHLFFCCPSFFCSYEVEYTQ